MLHHFRRKLSWPKRRARLVYYSSAFFFVFGITSAWAMSEEEFGKLLLPGKITVTNPFLDSCDSKRECGRVFKLLHAGIDYRARIPTEVRSPVSGTIVKLRSGNKEYEPLKDQAGSITVEVAGKEKPMYFFFVHMSKSFVKVGDKIKAGCIIGLTGKKGTIFPHLHVEYKEMRGRKNIRPTPSLKTIADIKNRGNISPVEAVKNKPLPIASDQKCG
ncbi:M23 family metallopeptidase [Kiloniella sp. EL199]|uniref:M23 family metallopeptidase n=1 Tax=Kiloniella sp. EL199 TaxID=2107581 RepID=UPI000EA33B84|nr:M23 family metallopeptidase [Kiloniella sp. EL199]